MGIFGKKDANKVFEKACSLIGKNAETAAAELEKAIELESNQDRKTMYYCVFADSLMLWSKYNAELKNEAAKYYKKAAEQPSGVHRIQAKQKLAEMGMLDSSDKDKSITDMLNKLGGA
jgi:hypothetical protein